MNIRFDGKVVMITGATGGVGLSLAKAFANTGAKLSLIARQKNAAELYAAELAAGTEYIDLRADLSQEKEINSIVQDTIARYSRIDVLVNCVGINIRKRLEEYLSQDWDMIMNVNLRSVFLLSKLVSGYMKTNRYGKIVNISSIQSVVSWTGKGNFSPAPYCASKAGLNSLTRSFAQELAPYNINVNAICPAVIDGKWAASLTMNRDIYDDIISKTPMKRLCSHEDIVGPVMLFASDHGSYITGQCLMVDGGWTVE